MRFCISIGKPNAFFFPLHLFKVPVNEEIIYRVKLKEKSQENALGFAIELEKRIDFAIK